MFNRESWVSLVPFLAVCLGAGGLASILTHGEVDTWYLHLRKPEWHPPDWVFGPVRTVLYVMMAISVWLVWRAGTGATGALVLFAVQLLLNTAWSLIFFRLHAIGLAFGEILLLWMMIVATAVAFLPISFLAAWLLLPYIAWVGFASYLNFRIWQMN
jgi:tryptophan-rich sensory protein